MICPRCGQPLVSLPRPPHEGETWLRCVPCGHWQIPAGQVLHREPYRPTGAKDNEPLYPDKHEVTT
jgi:hypothetical protein